MWAAAHRHPVIGLFAGTNAKHIFFVEDAIRNNFPVAQLSPRDTLSADATQGKAP
jgi:hypothetical protein